MALYFIYQWNSTYFSVGGLQASLQSDVIYRRILILQWIASILKSQLKVPFKSRSLVDSSDAPTISSAIDMKI